MNKARNRDNRLNIAMRSLCCLSLGLLLGCQTNPSATSDPLASPTLSPTPLAAPTEDVADRDKLVYTNENLGFRFSHPQGYTIEELEQGVTVWRDADYQNREDFVEATPLTIGLDENPENLPLGEWVKQRGYRIEGQIRSQSVASSEAVVFDWAGMWSFRSAAIALPNSNQIVVITLDREMEDYQEVFEDILATLKFL